MEELFSTLRAEGVVKVESLFAPTPDGGDVRLSWMIPYAKGKEEIHGGAYLVVRLPGETMDALEGLFLKVLLEEMDWYPLSSEERGEVTLDLEAERLIARVFVYERERLGRETLSLSEVCERMGVEHTPLPGARYVYEDGEWEPEPPPELEGFFAKLESWMEGNYPLVLRARIREDKVFITFGEGGSTAVLDERVFPLSYLSTLEPSRR